MNPADAVKVPAVAISPEIVIELVVLTEPVTDKELREIPDPLIVLEAPLNVIVPLECAKVPEPVVAKFPETLMAEELAVMLEAAISRL